jgi:multiple sugar transport system substrate-binding protein
MNTSPAMRLELLCVALLLAAGCHDPAPPVVAPSPKLDGVTVEFSAPAELQLAQNWQLQLEEWSASTGAQVQLRETQSAAERPPASPQATLAIIPLRELPDVIAADWMSPLDDSEIAQRDGDDVLRGLRNGIAQPGGKPQLIPLACPVLACYYRADLLEAAGRQPPETWEQYQALLSELDQWSNGLPALEPWSPEFRGTMFVARAASSALHPDNVSILLDLQSGDPLIGSEPFVAALDDSIAALKRLDPQSLQLRPEECVRALLEGKAALAIGTPSVSATDLKRDPNVIVGTIRLPGATRVYESTSKAWSSAAEGAPSHVTVIGFGGLALSASRAANAETRTAGWGLWDFLQRNTPEDELPFGPAICRQQDMPAALQRAQAGFTATEWRQQVESAVGALQETRVLLDLPLPESGRFRDALNARLTAAIDGTQPSADALQQAAADWQMLIKELGDRRVLNVYRQCHGLSPL